MTTKRVQTTKPILIMRGKNPASRRGPNFSRCVINCTDTKKKNKKQEKERNHMTKQEKNQKKRRRKNL